jgi:hypothetical protein
MTRARRAPTARTRCAVGARDAVSSHALLAGTAHVAALAARPACCVRVPDLADARGGRRTSRATVTGGRTRAARARAARRTARPAAARLAHAARDPEACVADGHRSAVRVAAVDLHVAVVVRVVVARGLGRRAGVRSGIVDRSIVGRGVARSCVVRAHVEERAARIRLASAARALARRAERALRRCAQHEVNCGRRQIDDLAIRCECGARRVRRGRREAPSSAREAWRSGRHVRAGNQIDAVGHGAGAPALENRGVHSRRASGERWRLEVDRPREIVRGGAACDRTRQEPDAHESARSGTGQRHTVSLSGPHRPGKKSIRAGASSHRSRPSPCSNAR